MRTNDRARCCSRIGSDGEFELANADGQKGIRPGEYKVIAVQIVLTEDLSIEEHRHGHTVLRRYADHYTGDLKSTINAHQTEPIKIVVEVE